MSTPNPLHLPEDPLGLKHTRAFVAGRGGSAGRLLRFPLGGRRGLPHPPQPPRAPGTHPQPQQTASAPRTVQVVVQPKSAPPSASSAPQAPVPPIKREPTNETKSKRSALEVVAGVRQAGRLGGVRDRSRRIIRSGVRAEIKEALDIYHNAGDEAVRRRWEERKAERDAARRGMTPEQRAKLGERGRALRAQLDAINQPPPSSDAGTGAS